MPMMFFALLRKNPVLLMSSSTSRGSAAARAGASGNRAKSAGVTMFTRLSVHCALRMVATASSSAS